MKEMTKEFAKDCGNVAIEGVKAVAVGEIIGIGSTVTVTEGLAIAYALGCQILRCTPEGKALEIATKAIAYGGLIGGTVLGVYLTDKLGTLEGFYDALDDVTDKYSKSYKVTVDLNYKPVMPE